MTADIENLVLEHLRAIRADMADVKLRVTQIDVQLSAMGQQLAGLTSAHELPAVLDGKGIDLEL